jgi:hypothetical protein
MAETLPQPTSHGADYRSGGLALCLCTLLTHLLAQLCALLGVKLALCQALRVLLRHRTHCSAALLDRFVTRLC